MYSVNLDPQRLAEVRDERGWTLTELAERVRRHYPRGVSVRFLSMLERGERRPGILLFTAICRALGVPKRELIRRSK